MKHILRPWIALTAAAAAIFIAAGATVAGQNEDADFRFRSGVDLVNVTATVVDRNGRFVPGLRREDFIIYEENERAGGDALQQRARAGQPGHRAGHERQHGRRKDFVGALGRRSVPRRSCLSPEDEIFLYTFSNYPSLLQDWTTDRQRLSRAIRRVNATGGTAMLDAIAESVPLAQTGQHRKRAVVLISDGNDTDSQSSLSEVKQMIRESEVMVYAIGIDSLGGEPTFSPPSALGHRRRFRRLRVRFREAGDRVVLAASSCPSCRNSNGRFRSRRAAPRFVEVLKTASTSTPSARSPTTAEDAPKSCAPAAISIRRRRTSQTSSAVRYYLGYASTTQKDGRWHSIRVETRDKSLRVRARRGYIATP